jgi:DNA-binding NarL/FixJ family response regulator
MKRIRILLADDHTIFAEGLTRVLEPEFEVVGCVDNGLALSDAVAEKNPDIAIVDISMPGLNGIDAVRRLRKAGQNTKIVFLSMHADPTFALEAFRAGASAYVIKTSDAGDLFKALRESLKGGVYISPKIAKDVITAQLNRAGKLEDVTLLTPRQREVLQLVSEGRSAKEIADSLRISLSTVEFHKAQIMKRLGVHSIAELVKYAVAHGLSSL